jgi:hypothetical protein
MQTNFLGNSNIEDIDSVSSKEKSLNDAQHKGEKAI